MTRFNKISDTSNPALTRAVIRALGDKECLIDVASPDHGGAEGGYPGFTYYSDTIPFFESNRKEILSILEADADDYGMDLDDIVMGIPCLRLSKDDHEEWRTYKRAVNRLLYSNRKVDWDRPEEAQIANALAWYSLESVARMMIE